MNFRHWQIAVLLLLLSTYSVLFYFVFTYQYKLDFSSFYSAFQLFDTGDNPYQSLYTTYLLTIKKLSANLNPPIVLWVLTPLLRLNYDLALIIWSGLSLLLGLIGAHFSFKLAFPADFIKKNWLSLYLIYLSLFATVMDTAIAQFGSILFFFIMTGYYCYLNNREYSAGLLWGIIIAMKFFPALLFFFVLKQGRYKVFMVMCVTLLVLCLIPWVVLGTTIYKQYFSMMTRVLWYGDSWNASLYGFLFRLFIDVHDKTQSLIAIKTAYIFLFFSLLFWYLKKSTGKSTVQNHQPFCLTLVMMLLMSPFGWLYYFPLLILPFACLWITAIDKKTNTAQLLFMWLISLFLLNFPIDYVRTTDMPTFLGKLGFYSFYFYGLLLMAHLLTRQPILPPANDLSINKAPAYFTPSLSIIISFGLLIPIISFVMRLFSIPGVPLLHY
ncbi:MULTISPECIES: glycosyltransferase family 87 protein [unclassified Legionella]|uniref:glycosyltransferase family 87 protein n=1 Tax=unclassified Legionella TaxID=2622702 RepID=UPI001E62D91B|nr:glycosyltransferase family 87 protein [Legionella sp. 31fI33]MCC5013571.1 DUF2029 domain-containing protein [Legionella sp. 31fI33]